MRHYRKYTDDDIVTAAAQVKSMSGLLKKLGLRPTGGNYDNMKRNLQRLGFKCEHWTGQLWNKEKRLKDWSQYARGSTLKPHLIKERGHKCEDCKRTKWKDEDIPLEVHHKDGERTNNDETNLELLCPNCHAMTKNWKNRSGA